MKEFTAQHSPSACQCFMSKAIANIFSLFAQQEQQANKRHLTIHFAECLLFYSYLTGMSSANFLFTRYPIWLVASMNVVYGAQSMLH